MVTTSDTNSTTVDGTTLGMNMSDNSGTTTAGMRLGMNMVTRINSNGTTVGGTRFWVQIWHIYNRHKRCYGRWKEVGYVNTSNTIGGMQLGMNTSNSNGTRIGGMKLGMNTV